MGWFERLSNAPWEKLKERQEERERERIRLAEEQARQEAEQHRQEAERKEQEDKARVGARLQAEKDLQEVTKRIEDELKNIEEKQWAHHPNIPYLNRLKNEYKQSRLAVETLMLERAKRNQTIGEMLLSGIFETAFQGFLGNISNKNLLEPELYLSRIENIAAGNYQAEIVFFSARDKNNAKRYLKIESGCVFELR
jgi:actin-related protein